MTLSPEDWHIRFTRQALWTAELRDYLFQHTEIEKAQRILEVGCGTGAILTHLPTLIPLRSGVDINHAHIEIALRNAKGTGLVQGDAYSLPYQNDCFELSFCHFLLLWIADPIEVLQEMARVTSNGGAVLALAEPDYGGRIDYPQTLSQLGDWQIRALRKQGADPMIGRQLASLFHQVGLHSVQSGVLGGQWVGSPDWDAWESEWSVLESDLNDFPNIFTKLGNLKKSDRSAYEKGERVLFVPTFYAWGRVPFSS